MSATLKRTHPLVDAMKEQGIAVDENPNSVNDVLDKLAQKALKTAEDKSRIDAIKALTQPAPAPDPFESFTKVAPILGLADTREERRIRQEKEERERLEAIERREREERREEERREQARIAAEAQQQQAKAAAEAQQQMGFAQLLVTMMEKSNDKMAAMIERSERNTLEVLKAIKSNEPRESEFERALKLRALEQLTNPEPAPDPILSYLENAEKMAKLASVFGGGGNSSTRQWDIEEKRLDLEAAHRKEQLEIDKLKAKANADQIGGGLNALASALMGKMGGQQPQGPKVDDVPRAIYRCGEPGCDGSKIDEVGLNLFTCPKCDVTQPVVQK